MADDEPEILEMVRFVLEQAGHEVVATDHGRDVEKHLDQMTPDLMLLDIMLPGIDGYSILNKISGAEKTKSIPVIVMSVLDAAKNLFDRFPQVYSFVNKPFQPEELLQKVNSALSKFKTA